MAHANMHSEPQIVMILIIDNIDIVGCVHRQIVENLQTGYTISL